MIITAQHTHTMMNKAIKYAENEYRMERKVTHAIELLINAPPEFRAGHDVDLVSIEVPVREIGRFGSL